MIGCKGLSALKLGLQGCNGGGSLIYHGDGATKSKKIGVHEECVKQGKECLDQGKKLHKCFSSCLERDGLEDALNEAHSRWNQ